MSYFDLRSELWRDGFEAATPFSDYVAAGNERERANWARTTVATPVDAAERLDSAGRILNVLCLSGLWCGDCARTVPVWDRLAQAAGPGVDFRVLDRDARPEVRDELRILGAMRVPVAVFLTEDFHEVGRLGDRPLSVYRDKAVTELGAACPLPGAAGPLAAEIAEWGDDFERLILMARLAPGLRRRHGD